MVFFMFLLAEEKMPPGRAAKVQWMYDVRNQASLILAGRHVGKYPLNLNPPDSLVMAPWLWNQWLPCSPLVTLLFFFLKMWEKAIKLSKELAQTYESRVFDYEGLGDLLVSDQKMSFLLQGGWASWSWTWCCKCKKVTQMMLSVRGKCIVLGLKTKKDEI